MKHVPYVILVRFGATRQTATHRRRDDARTLCRRMVRHLGHGASGKVTQGSTLVYRCYAVHRDHDLGSSLLLISEGV